MTDIVSELLNKAFAYILDEHLQNYQIARLLLLLAMTFAVSWSLANWRFLANRQSHLRRITDEKEKYAGIYLESMDIAAQRLYSIVKIRFNSNTKQYELTGTQYDMSGRETATFRSDSIRFPTRDRWYLEFIWQGSEATELLPTDGYTRFDIRSRTETPLSGTGFVVFFKDKPSFTFAFRHLNRHAMKELTGKSYLHTKEDETAFVCAYHSKSAMASTGTLFIAAGIDRR